MTWIKICGITDLEDALVAAEAGADALGFVFYEKSPRRVAEETVRQIVEQLPRTVEKVGVFVGHPDSAGVALRCGLDAMQTCIRRDALPRPNKLLAPQDRSKFKDYWALPFSTFSNGHIGRSNLSTVGSGEFWKLFDAFFIDSATDDIPGGTGQKFDWNAAVPVFAALNRHVKAVLAGGLNEQNVGDAMALLHPWGVDVSSGVESRPGKKDPDKVRAFIKAVREADAANTKN